jgi:hypothetical protein
MTDVTGSSPEPNVEQSESLSGTPSLTESSEGQMASAMREILSKKSKETTKTKVPPVENEDIESKSAEVSPEQKDSKEAPVPYQAFKARLAKEKSKRMELEHKYESETAELKKAVEILQRQAEELRSGRYSLDPKDEAIREFQLANEIREFKEKQAKELEERRAARELEYEVEELKTTLISDAQAAAKSYKLVTPQEILKVMAADPNLDARSAAKAINDYKRSLYEESKPPIPTADVRSIPRKATEFKTRGADRQEMMAFMANRLNGKL